MKLGDGVPGESVYGEGTSTGGHATARGTLRGERRDAEGGEWEAAGGKRVGGSGEVGEGLSWPPLRVRNTLARIEEGTYHL